MKSQAFTLVELLTVIAIVGVLATLLLAAVGSARKASWQARCTSNLRQIALGFSMYLDDIEKRPPSLDALVHSRYLPAPHVLLCPADKTRDWGGLVNGFKPPDDTTMFPSTVFDAPAPERGLPFSYLHPLNWPNEAWARLNESGSAAGIATCQVHGLGRPNLEYPSMRDFQGLILRAQRDAAVVRRKWFWPDLGGGPNFPPTMFRGQESSADSFQLDATVQETWGFFTDEPRP